MNRSHPWLIAAGALLLAITNAVVLVGVAFNRRQPPDSVLTLTERELRSQWSWMWREGENSGLSVRLRYRVESSRNSSSAQSGAEETFSSYGSFGPIAWLDRDKLAALGFDVAQPLTSADTDTHYNRMLERDVLLVLELDGPVHARALQAARDLLAHREHDSAANPERQESAERLRNAQQALQREEYAASRLFVVDAGLDQTALRQRYPDRTQYAIVNGNIRPYVMRDETSARLYGAVTAVRCETINVPLQFRETVPHDRPTGAENEQPFILEVALGSRLEPWIVSGHAGPT
jgi:hypothetical protein